MTLNFLSPVAARWARRLAACLLAAALAGCLGDNQDNAGQPGNGNSNQTQPPAKLRCAP
ncbi:hypothetical protein JW897_11360 [Chromobacterium alkanivorans]|uniref:hypothetical protein n=1 Tax=Chromobacterium alkanivorans TaxID=1071719 RepID=UPI001966F4C8|nr:hypothetical protein [Chromobacterium alkanivorans]MBN3004330.1 hypothetical protein [Chromobacterium alkanivorans]